MLQPLPSCPNGIKNFCNPSDFNRGGPAKKKRVKKRKKERDGVQR
jgi:hypothetical protein